MNDEALDRLVAETAWIDDARVAELAVSEAERTLLEAIMSTPRDTETVGAHRRRKIPRRFAATLAAAAVLLAAFVGIQAAQPRPESAWASEVVAVARVAPRLLVDEPGWKVSRAEEFTGERGEMTFESGDDELDLAWIPAGEHDRRVEDRAHSAELHSTGTVNGHPAQIFRYFGGSEYVALWVQGSHSVQARGAFPSLKAFRAMLADLVEVDVDTWLSALPDTVVRPGARATLIDEMLADVPLPPGFDPSGIKKSIPGVSGRYNVGADATGAVTCTWIDRWLDATDRGDTAEAQQAVDAMATSRKWKILTEMDREGDWPEVVWEFADAMADPAPDPADVHSVEGIRNTYAEAFGCSRR
ncbi:MAG: hypothetical protein JWM47_1643 [Acidimicrobiales bacterium]|nr:hypothetical protein [Acidimicrobiales bacterium]